jgi:tRNA A37 N6-isopentenylltransferase MiaA
MLLGGSILLVLAMLREIWWSEKARRSIERARDEHLAKEREFGRARQRERGD